MIKAKQVKTPGHKINSEIFSKVYLYKSLKPILPLTSNLKFRSTWICSCILFQVAKEKICYSLEVFYDFSSMHLFFFLQIHRLVGHSYK